jgi:hypothetical protein
MNTATSTAAPAALIIGQKVTFQPDFSADLVGIVWTVEALRVLTPSGFKPCLTISTRINGRAVRRLADAADLIVEVA